MTDKTNKLIYPTIETNNSTLAELRMTYTTTLTIDVEKLQDLATIKGKEQAAQQLGNQLIELIAKRHPKWTNC